MCGITGFAQAKVLQVEQWEQLLRKMATGIQHRGPDDFGVWCDASAGIGLGHRRLSIVDLSSLGHQPMLSESGRFIIVYNGEIYNYLDITAQLKRLGYTFRGHSDTEVLLTAFEEWGVEAAIQRTVGMFAIALYDMQAQKLYLIRDRLGEKPLYYGWSGNTFLFGSELKALRAHPAWQGEINRDALALYTQYNYVPSPHSIFQGIFKLTPGTILTLSLPELKPGSLPLPSSYWSARNVVENGTRDPFPNNPVDATDQLEALIRQSIAGQMIADVPLGAFLSGGIDSSTTVALMQAQSSRPIKTFSIGFYEEAYNEAVHAKSVAKHLGTDHTELYVTPEEALAVIPRLPAMYDEPFADSSQIPTYLVSHLARQHVTVSLSGDAGDELFAGYNRYFWANRIWERIGWAPREMRGWLANGLTSLSPQSWDKIYNTLSFALPKQLQVRMPGDKVHKFSRLLGVPSREAVYQQLVSQWYQPTTLVLDSRVQQTILTDRSQWASLSDFTMQMMYLDLVTYLLDDILVKVDRAAMSVSLETRVPFLDHRIVEFAWRLPMTLKVRDGKTKWLLRQVLYRHVPKELIERPKMGFGIPLDRWLRGPLMEWAEVLLDEKRLRNEGFFNPTLVRNKWHEHKSGAQNWAPHLWSILMFQAWLT